MKALTEAIKQYALQTLGFSAFGVLSVQDLSAAETGIAVQEGQAFEQWLDNGYDADMDWMAQRAAFRKAPWTLLENCQSMVCVTLNYHQPNPTLAQPVHIASYALGQDYHRVLRGKLKQLLRYVQQQAQAMGLPRPKGRTFSDSAPLLEKSLAKRAGLGWLGKHSNLISPTHGSWVFLGELLLTLPLSVHVNTPEVPDYCGRCTRCIDACPTQAIVEPGVVDANRCISYWTIESDVESFPPVIAENLQSWAFGCDICQQVCPWNHKLAQPTSVTEFSPLPVWSLPIEQWAEPETFAQNFAQSSVLRTGAKNFSRNIKTVTK